jgi:hypothetical protein
MGVCSRGEPRVGRQGGRRRVVRGARAAHLEGGGGLGVERA